VRRNEEQCTHCRACTTHCPTLIDVENKTVVKSEECFGCLTCVSRCSAPGALDLTVSVGKKVSVVKGYLFPIILILVLYLVVGIGMVSDKWHSRIPYEDYQQLIPEVLKDYVKR